MVFDDKELHKLIIVKKFAIDKQLESSYIQMLCGFNTIKQTKKVRVYKDNGVRDDLAIQFNKIVFDNKKDIHTQIKKTLQTSDYCIAISELEKFSLPISDFFTSNIIESWNQKFGIQLMGFELYSFFGKYNITPFGIHDDKEHTILIYIGPNKFKIFSWE